MLPYSPRYSDRSSLPGWPAMSGKRAGKPRYRLGVSQGGCGTGSVLRLGREWNRRLHEGPPSWLSEVATAAWTGWRRCSGSSRSLATPSFERIAVPRRRVRAGHPETEPPGHHEDEPGGQSVPFRGFRGLQVVRNPQGIFRNRRVSVPFRGFRGLQVATLGGTRSGHGGYSQVSVPFRGFRGLQAADVRARV